MGGFALAAGFQRTGLAQLIGSQFEAMASLPTFLMILLVCLMLTFLTELTSNLATTEMILPILASIAVVTETHPLILMIPAALSASCAFMIRESDYFLDRFVIDNFWQVLVAIVGALVIASVVFTVGIVVFEIDPSVLPEWASSMARPTG